MLASLSEISRIKVKPGISSYATDESLRPQDVGESMSSLIEHAKLVVPQSHHEKTRIYLKATAGMRLLKSTERENILRSVRQYLGKTPFAFEPHFASVISGKREAMYAWVSVNHATGGFTCQLCVQMVTYFTLRAVGSLKGLSVCSLACEGQIPN